MRLTVNGEAMEVEARTLDALLKELQFEDDWLATAVNSDLVPSEERSNHGLNEDDKIEILSPRAGG
jgi:sulfur carrier protein